MKKTVLVTGGGRGLGKGVSLALAAQGHEVLITARDPAAGAATVREAKASNTSARIEAFTLDLASFASIDACARALEGRPLDVVMHVAGVMQQSPTLKRTVDGFEETLAVNVLAPFLLTHHLLGHVRAGGRVVAVSSRLHLPGARGPEVRFDFEDPNLERAYNPEVAYKNSKLALLWFTYELARRYPKERFTAHAVCPGFVPETAQASVKGFQRFMLAHVLRYMPFATRLTDAVEALCFVALDPTLDASTGGFWAERARFESSPQSHHLDEARRFWAFCETSTRSGPWP